MSQTIMFVHGMFLNAKSWENWQRYFESEGFECIAPPWPLHEGDPAQIRANPPVGLGKLSLDAVIEKMREAALPHENLILVGHSVGGLIVQKLISEGIGQLGIPICSVAPNRMMTFDWGMLRNVTSIINPLKGDELYPMDADGFYQNFGNTMLRADSDAAFEKYGLSESRNVLRDCLGETGKIDLEQKHPPLLFVGAEQDEIIPPALCQKNAKAYGGDGGRVDFREFKERGHFICGQSGWEEVAAYISAWIHGKGLSVTPSSQTRMPTSLSGVV
jgi:pimeloyl-ACP methyl ester carboxylesterase